MWAYLDDVHIRTQFVEADPSLISNLKKCTMQGSENNSEVGDISF